MKYMVRSKERSNHVRIIPTSTPIIVFLIIVSHMLVSVLAQDSPDPPTYAYQNPTYQNFLTEFKILDTTLDYASLREQILLAINQIQISLESVKQNLQVHNISLHDV